MKSLLKYSFLLFNLSLFAQVQTLFKNEPQKVAIPFSIVYQMENKGKWQIPSVQKREIEKNFEIVGYKQDTIKDKIQLELKLMAFDSGVYHIPSYTFLQDGKTYTSASQDVKVSRVKVNMLQKPMYDIKPIKQVQLTTNDYFNKYRWILWGFLGTVLFILLGFLIYFIVKNFKKPKKEKQLLPPGEEALLALKSLNQTQSWKNDSKQYYSDLTDILRRYFERKLKFDALESTSDEILEEIKPHLVEEEFQRLKSLLYDADLVKFAKLTPQENQSEIHLASSFDLIQSIEERKTEAKIEEVIKEKIEVKERYFDNLGTWIKQTPKGSFAMWWDSSPEDVLTDSKTLEVYDTLFEEYLLYAPFILGTLFYEKKILATKQEVLLTAEENIYFFENEQVGIYIMIVSEEKGIRFLFNTQRVTQEKREDFLTDFVEQVRILAENEVSHLKRREYKKLQYGEQAQETYKFMKGMVLRAEKEGKIIEKMGAVNF